MSDLKKLISSRRGHKCHLAKILASADDILAKLSTANEEETDATAVISDSVLLAENLKQLRLKARVFEELDDKIIDSTEDEEKIETAVFEAADLQTTLSEKMALIQHTLQTLSKADVAERTAPTEQTNPLPQPREPQSGKEETPTKQQSNIKQVDHVSTNNSSNSSHQPAADSSNTHAHSTSHMAHANTSAHVAHANTSAHMAHTHKSTTGSDIPPTYHFGARLPKLEIPVFSGEPLDWQPFWDCFAAAIDTNPSLSGVQKLSYLRAQLRGEASRVITGLPLTNLNYNHSVTLLKERYGQSQKIISAHIQALLDLPKPSNKLASLRFFHDTVETHVRCLESLGKSPESLDTLLAPMILTKLPEETRRNMARGHTSAEWTVLEIQTAICNEIRIFETGQQISASQQGSPTASFHTSLHRKPQLKRETSNKLSCVYCKGNHAAINCEVHKEAASRIEIIRQQRLCYNCLAHHRVSQCHSKNRCRKCGNKLGLSDSKKFAITIVAMKLSR